MSELPVGIETLTRDVRIYVFREAAATALIPQAPRISRALGRSERDVRLALHQLAADKVLILAPNDGDIWAANPFCAVPSGFRVNGARREISSVAQRSRPSRRGALRTAGTKTR